MAVTGAIKRCIVQQKRHIVAAEFDIAFKHPVAMAYAEFEGSQRIFRCEFASASVGYPAGVGPRLDNGSGRHLESLARITVKPVQTINTRRDVNGCSQLGGT